MGINLSSFLQCRLNIYLYLTFGWSIAKVFVFIFGNLYFFFNRREKELVENAVTDCIGRSSEGAGMRKVIRAVFRGILSHYYEKLYIAFEKPEKAREFLRNNIDGRDLEVLGRSVSEGKGVIVVTGHYGAIEYIPTLLAVYGFPVSMIAKFKTEQLRKKVFAQAGIYGIKLIDTENTGNVMAAAFSELRAGRILITQCDEIEEWKPSKRQQMSFLGRTTGLDRTINIMQKRTSARLVFGIIHRYDLKRYRLIMRSHEDIAQTDGFGESLSPGEAVLRHLEQFIYVNPEQWYQWKKYLEIEQVGEKGKQTVTPVPSLSVRPALGVAG